MIRDLSWEDLQERAAVCAAVIARDYPGDHEICGYAVPSGGVPAALLVCKCLPRLRLVERPAVAQVFIDDLIDSGATRDRYLGQHPSARFYVLVNKSLEDPSLWLRFPWERAKSECGPEDNIRRILQYIGEDPNRDGLRDTPARVVRSYGELYAGYKQDPATMLTVFENDGYDELVLLRDIEFSSTCEHHLLPFFGSAHIAYIPDGRVIGISKLARVLEVFSRRLQLQERICEQVTGALMEHLRPKGAACMLQARHLCMCHRGVGKQHSTMVTSSLKGVFLEDAKTRAEFYQLIRN